MRKQSSTNEEWEKLWQNCTKIVSESKIHDLTLSTIDAVERVANSGEYSRIAYAYSGGKDSIVLLDLLKKASVKLHGGFCVLHTCEYPAFEKWIYLNIPNDVEVLKLDTLGLKELNENPNFLFPTGTKERNYYTSQWRQKEKEYVQKHSIDLVIAGRRKSDGNFCGKEKGNGVYFSKNKLVESCNLIASWKHEEVLAYIRYNGLELPPIYDYPNGWVFGTHPWTERDRVNNSIYETFDEIMEIDPSILQAAANELAIANEYLKERFIK